MNATTTPLDCGHPLDPLLDRVAAEIAGTPPATPEPDCPTCRAELARLRASWGGVRAAAARPVTVPPDLTQRVLVAVRAARGRSPGTPAMIVGDRGVTRLTERALLALTRRLATDYAADRGGLRVGQVSADGNGVHVQLQVSLGLDINVLTDQLRGWLRTHLGADAGLELPALHLHVTDVQVGDV